MLIKSDPLETMVSNVFVTVVFDQNIWKNS